MDYKIVGKCMIVLTLSSKLKQSINKENPKITNTYLDDYNYKVIYQL